MNFLSQNVCALEELKYKVQDVLLYKAESA